MPDPPAVLVDDVDVAQRTLVEKLQGEDVQDLHGFHAAELAKYVESELLPKVEGPFAIGELRGNANPWIFVAHRAGVDLFRVSMRADNDMQVEHQILPPPYDGTYCEQTWLSPRLIANGMINGVTSTATVIYTHPTLTELGGTIIVSDHVSNDEGDAGWKRVRAMVDLLRAWARTPDPVGSRS